MRAAASRAALCYALTLWGCSPYSPRPVQFPSTEWSDAQVLQQALTARDTAIREPQNPAAGYDGPLGRHHGQLLGQTLFCGDTGCDRDHTDLVVHYELPEGVTCESIGGVRKGLMTEAGYAPHTRYFCFPKILTEHWAEVAPKMAPLNGTP